MFDINTKVQWRTGGRGVFRILKGTVIAVVKAGKLPKTKSMMETLPHGDKPSNRDRYIVEVKDGVFCWANIRTCWKQGEKMPPAKHRFGVKSKPKPKVAKVKKPLKVASIKAKLRRAKKAAEAKVEEIAKGGPTVAPVKKSGGDKPKTTWYGFADGKVVTVRKVICPPGYHATKPTLPEVPATNTLASPPPAEPPSEPPLTGASTALPSA
jgi:hypothetical protein